MKKILFAILLLLSAPANASDRYVIDPTHTTVTWFANHLGYSDTVGQFTQTEGSIFFDQQKPANSWTKITIKADSIQTIVPKLTEHLKNQDFFNVSTYPVIKFESTGFKEIGKKNAIMLGNLTMLGQTKPVKMKVRFNKAGKNPMSQKRTVGFSAETTINRSEWGMKYGIPNVSDKVKILIEVEATHEEDVLLQVN